MAVSPKWKFILARSSDMVNVGQIFRPKNVSLSLVFNRAGSLSFTMSLDEEYAPHVWPFTSCIKAYRRGSDGAWRLIWSGFVNAPMEEDPVANTISVSCSGWLQWLEKRKLRRAKDWTANNPSTSALYRDWEIIYDILGDANATTLTWDNNYVVPGIYSDLSASATLLPTPLVRGTATGDFSTHARQYKIDRGADMLQEIYKLTDLENGCDVLVDPEMRRLNVYAYRGTNRPNAVFSYGWGPANLGRFSRTIDPTSTVTYFLASGQDNTITPRFADTKLNPAPTQDPPLIGEDSMQTYGLIEEFVSLSDAKNTEILATYAGGEIMLRSTPRITYEMTPFPFTLTLGPGRIPEPFVDYDLGDTVYLTARVKGRFQVSKQPQRVFGITVTPDENGNEILGRLQVTPT